MSYRWKRWLNVVAAEAAVVVVVLELAPAEEPASAEAPVEVLASVEAAAQPFVARVLRHV